MTLVTIRGSTHSVPYGDGAPIIISIGGFAEKPRFRFLIVSLTKRLTSHIPSEAQPKPLNLTRRYRAVRWSSHAPHFHSIKRWHAYVR